MRCRAFSANRLVHGIGYMRGRVFWNRASIALAPPWCASVSLRMSTPNGASELRQRARDHDHRTRHQRLQTWLRLRTRTRSNRREIVEPLMPNDCADCGHRSSRYSSRVGEYQLAFAGILDEDRQQHRGLRPTGIARDSVVGAWSLIEAFTCSIDARPFVVHGAHNLARHHVSVNEGGVWMPVRRRGASGRIDDFHRQKRFSGNIRKLTLENGRGGRRWLGDDPLWGAFRFVCECPRPGKDSRSSG
jgi:hypothetical protein